MNTHHYISKELGIKNPVHKHKLSIKAMDVVLFGPTKSKYPSVIILTLNSSRYGILSPHFTKRKQVIVVQHNYFVRRFNKFHHKK